MNKHKQFQPISLFITTQVMLLIVFTLTIFINNQTFIIICYIILAILCVISYFASYQVFKSISLHAKIEAKNEIIEKQQKIQVKHLMALKDQINDIDLIKQEINEEHIYNNLTNLDETRNYVNDLIDKHLSYTTDYCDNKIVDAIIFDKVPKFKENNIDYLIQVVLPEFINIEIIDLITLFVNIIDNAIEGCLQVEKNRFINIDAKIEANYLVIKVSNSKNININVSLTNKTSKQKDKQEHGYGLKILANTCKKYKGKLNIDNLENEVKISAVLKLKE